MQITDWRYGAAALSTFDEERQEAVESVWAALGQGDLTPDQSAACTFLLRHLFSSGREN